MRAEAPAVKMQKTNSSQRRSSVALRRTSSNSARRARISRRRSLYAARILSGVTGSLSRRTCSNYFKNEAGLTDLTDSDLNEILLSRFLECQKKVYRMRNADFGLRIDEGVASSNLFSNPHSAIRNS